MTIIEDKELAEKYLKGHLEEIRLEGCYNCRHTSDSVFGKEVRFLNKNNIEEKYELQSWCVTGYWDKDCDVDTLIKQLKFLAHKKEFDEIIKFLDTNKLEETVNPVIEQLYDWQFLEDIVDGNIISKGGVITLVKYAVVVKKED